MFIATKSKYTGFTLMEMLIAISIGIIASTFLMLIVVNGMKYFRAIQQEERLQANAAFLAGKLAYWVRQGKSFDPSSTPEKLVINLPCVPPSPCSQKIFLKDTNTLKLDGESLLSGEIQINSLNFTYLARSTKINFELQFKNSNTKFLVTTTFSLRNI